MNHELIVRSDGREVDIALLSNKELVELYKEQGNAEFAVGDIYLGKIRRVIPSLNAAFVDVGYERDAFLHYLDLGPQYRSLNKFVKGTLSGKQTTADLKKFPNEKDIDKNGKIDDVVAANQQILVQVAKEPISSKGPRLTSEITLAGRFLILAPFSDKISLSQKIKHNEERTRLRRLMTSIKPKNCGVIVRTVAENKKVAELDSDLRDLFKRWKLIHKNLKNAKPPTRVLGEISRTSTVLRDMLSSNFSRIVVDDHAMAEEVKGYLQKISPKMVDILKEYEGKTDVFERHGIYRQIKTSFGQQVNLKSGAYLIVEHTEAMHVIDVNSGSRKGGAKNQEQNALETNLECAKEIARILRLRDMGGIIAVDFIDMQEKQNQRQLFDKFKEYLKNDRAKHNVTPPSRFGVIELTRQRVREVTDISTEEKCPCCNGTGEIQASILLTEQIENQLRYTIEELKPRRVVLKTHPYVEAFLNKGLFSIRRRWMMQYKKNIGVQGSTSYNFMEYHFFDGKNKELEA